VKTAFEGDFERFFRGRIDELSYSTFVQNSTVVENYSQAF
jgi:hypothetical protein